MIWVGSGEGKPREDITYGTGVYRSTDGGDTWTPRGLVNTQHITSLRVHPTNPDVAYVTALGHAFGPSPDRGVAGRLVGLEKVGVSVNLRAPVGPMSNTSVAVEPTDKPDGPSAPLCSAGTQIGNPAPSALFAHHKNCCDTPVAVWR